MDGSYAKLSLKASGCRVLHDPEVLRIIIEYSQSSETRDSHTSHFTPSPRPFPVEGEGWKKCGISLIGEGNFSKAVLAPALAKSTAKLIFVSARTNGATAAHIARKYGFDHASTNLDAILADDEVNTVFIATPHNSHPVDQRE